MHVASQLIAMIDDLEARVEQGEDVDVGALTQACQDLVAWAARFDAGPSGRPAQPMGSDDAALIGAALEAIRRSGDQLRDAQEHITRRIRGGKEMRRGLGGYACIKSASSERQYVDIKA